MAASPDDRSRARTITDALARFACPNADCALFNRFAAGNLRVVEQRGRQPPFRRLYCTACSHRFSERQGTLWAYAKLPPDVIVRVLKCLVHGCSIEAAADICEVQPQTVARLLEVAGRRAEDFHRLQLDRLPQPPAAVQLDEMHARVAGPAAKKRGADRAHDARTAVRDAAGCMRLWR